MVYKRLSISLPSEVEEAVRREAAIEGVTVSAWLAELARSRANIAAGLRASKEYEAEFGAFTEADLAAGRRLLYGDPEDQGTQRSVAQQSEVA